MNIALLNKDASYSTVRAKETGVPGIAARKRNGEWELTHIPSGKRFPFFCKRKKTALYVARELGRLADWSLLEREIKRRYPWKRVVELSRLLFSLNAR